MFIHQGKVPSERSTADMATANGGLLPEHVISRCLKKLKIPKVKNFCCLKNKNIQFNNIEITSNP